MNHYREYVGYIEDFEETGLQVFNFLLDHGLQPNHRFLDIGCGCLRIGRHIIPYLDKNNYHAIEPAKEIIDEAIKNEILDEIIQEKNPVFTHQSDFSFGIDNFDFVLAYDVFYHCGKSQLEQCLRNLHLICKPKTKIFISVMWSNTILEESKKGLYQYKHSSHSNVWYTTDEFMGIASKNGYKCMEINENEIYFFGCRIIYLLEPLARMI